MTMGRPTIYSQALAAQICTKLSEGVSLRRICQREGMPELKTIMRWLADTHFPFNKDFRQQYTRAREAQAEVLADEMIDIAEDGSNDWYEDEDGKERPDHEHINRSRLRIDTRKWIASKLLPKKYGDKQTIDINSTSISVSFAQGDSASLLKDDKNREAIEAIYERAGIPIYKELTSNTLEGLPARSGNGSIESEVASIPAPTLSQQDPG